MFTAVSIREFDNSKNILDTIICFVTFLLLFLSFLSGGPLAESTAAFAETETLSPISEEVIADFTKGVYLMESGNTHKALDFFEAAWERSNHHPTIGIKLAQAYYYLKRFALSEAVAEEVLSQDENSFTALLIRAKIKYLQNDLAGSLEYIQKITQSHETSYEIQRMLGNIYFEINDVENALKAYENALLYDPHSPFMLYRYGLLLKETGQLDGAEDAFRKAIASNPELTESAVELAGILLDSGRLDEAVPVLTAAIQNGQRINEALLLLSTLYLETGRLDEGIQLLEQQKRRQDLPRDARILLGQLYLEAKEYGEAEAIFKKLFQEEGNNAELAKILGDINLQSGSTERALLFYRKAINIAPYDYRRYLELFFAASPRFAPEDVKRINLSDTDEAGILHKAGSLIGAEDFHGHYLVGISYLSIDSLETARRFLNRALELEPDDEGTLLNLANIAERTKSYEEAERYLRKLYEQKPDDPTICNFYGYLLAEMGKDLDRAEALIRKALEKEPTNGYYIDSLGWVLYRRGDYGQAVTELEKASKLVDGDPVILEHLGDAYRALKRYHEALAAYEQSEAISGGNSSIIEKIESTKKGLE